jgi:hypothetical protein
MLGQTGYRPVTLDGGHSHRGGSGAVVCSLSLLFTAIIAALRLRFHLSSCADFRLSA